MASTTALVADEQGRTGMTAAVERGTTRLLNALGCATLRELGLPSGRRADIVALHEAGELWIVEIKSAIEDFRADHKWGDYRRHCDRLFFATAPEVPADIFPPNAGLIVADRFGAHLLREAPLHRLAAATRRTMVLRFAKAAAHRLQALLDPAAVDGELAADLSAVDAGPRTCEGRVNYRRLKQAASEASEAATRSLNAPRGPLRA